MQIFLECLSCFVIGTKCPTLRKEEDLTVSEEDPLRERNRKGYNEVVQEGARHKLNRKFFVSTSHELCHREVFICTLPCAQKKASYQQLCSNQMSCFKFLQLCESACTKATSRKCLEWLRACKLIGPREKHYPSMRLRWHKKYLMYMTTSRSVVNF